MTILPNTNGWSYDDSNSWKLVHDGNNIIIFEQMDKTIGTQFILFVGNQEECDAEIARLGLTWPSQIIVNEEVVGNQEDYNAESTELEQTQSLEEYVEEPVNSI